MKNLLFIILILPFLAFGQDYRTITVFGNAEVKMAPDLITVLVTYTEYEKTENSNLTDFERAFAELLDAWSIPKQDVEISGMSAHRNNYYSKKKVRATKSYQVKIRQSEKVSAFTAAVMSIPFSDIQIMNIEYTKKEQVLMEVSKKAIANAREKAQMMAEAQNETIGKTISIKEMETTGNEGLERKEYNRLMAYGAVSRAYGTEDTMSPFDMMKVTLYAKVQVVYEIK